MPLPAAGDGRGDAGKGGKVRDGPYIVLGDNGLVVTSGNSVALSNGSRDGTELFKIVVIRKVKVPRRN